MITFRCLKQYRFPLILIASLFIGALTGIYFPKIAMVVTPIGEIFINLLLVVIVPLVSVSVASSIAHITDLKKLGLILLVVLLISIMMAMVASFFMIGLACLMDPAHGVTLTFKQAISSHTEHIDIVKMLTVHEFSGLLSNANILALVIMSIIGGIAIGQSGEHGKRVASLLQSLNVVMMKIVAMLMYVAPVGLSCYFASVMASQDAALLGSFSRAIGIFFLGTIIYLLIGSTIYAWLANGREGITNFWTHVFPSMTIALGTSSSLASLPVNLRTAKKMKLKEEVAEICLPLLINLNKGGVALTVSLNVVFIYSALGLSFTPSVLFTTLLLSVLLSVVISGVPGGAFLSEVFVVTTLGLPMKVIPILVIIGAATDAMATVINVVHDLSAAQLIEKILGRRLLFIANSSKQSK